MSYIVFARKYRPQAFDDIVGQAHITTTLKNAISQDHVAHAYLFAGPRGVGKTTTARTLAKALSCDKGPTPKPCNSCPTCKEITQGSSLDILEIDGASNRGIEEIRNLRDNIKFAPSKGKFKIYIIDEVHMLTADAFNALLKTLEEPPPHVKFIFATTQAHKVPQTILSRCQRFDFRRITTRDAFENLKRIAKEEKLNVKDEALGLIAKYSDGSMRDAQVILDQISSFTGGKVGPSDVADILGIVDEEILFGLSGAIAGKDPVTALKIIDRLINEGKDSLQVIGSLIEHFRNISVAKITNDLTSLIDASSERIKAYLEESKKFTIEEILYIIYNLSNTIDFIKKSNLPRIPFEAALIKLTVNSPIISLTQIMERMDKIPVRRPVLRSPEGEGGSISEDGDQRPKTVDSPGQSLTEARPARPAAEGGPQATTTINPAGQADMDEILSSWAGVINYIKAKKISIASYLQEGYPVAVDKGTLTIGFPKELQFHKEVLESPDNRRLIEEAVSHCLKLDLKVGFILVEPAGSPRPGMGDYPGTMGDSATGNEPIQAKEVDPIVKAALEMFGGEIASKPSGRVGRK